MGFVSTNCPGCGAPIELDDSREFGFCQYCGTKIVQDKVVVEHRGNVKIDNSDFVQKYLLNARRAKEKGDWAEVEKYYNLVEQNEPENIEAIFFSAYGKLRCTILENYSAKWDNDFAVLKKSISVLDDCFDMSHELEQRKVIEDAANCILIMEKPKEHGIIVGKCPDENPSASEDERIKALNELLNGNPAASGYKKLKKLNTVLYPQMIETIDNIIKKYTDNNLDYNYLLTIKDLFVKANSKANGGCYVATAVYGSYDCPQVWTLRRFRDYELASTWYGRLFISVYYAVSPRIIKMFGDSRLFNDVCRSKLDRMVKNLQSKGYESTPYQDINWR